MTIDELTALENESIRLFVESCGEYLGGRVLDYGCGQSPYSYVVKKAGGVYLGYDRAAFYANMSGKDIGEPVPGCDAILCTQVIHLADDPAAFCEGLHDLLKPGGHLILTGQENWPEVNEGDKWRFTREGIVCLLYETGFAVIRAEHRWAIPFDGWELPMGWGACAVAR